MHHFFLVDQVSGLVDGAHEQRQIIAPVVEHFIRILLLLEGHNARESIHLAADRLVYDQRRQKLLGLLVVQVEQVGHALCVNASVILCHHSHILQNLTTL